MEALTFRASLRGPPLSAVLEPGPVSSSMGASQESDYSTTLWTAHFIGSGKLMAFPARWGPEEFTRKPLTKVNNASEPALNL